MNIRGTEHDRIQRSSHLTIFHFIDPSSNTFKNIYFLMQGEKLSVSACLKCQRKKIKPDINAVILTLIRFCCKSAGFLIFRFVNLWSFSVLLFSQFLEFSLICLQSFLIAWSILFTVFLMVQAFSVFTKMSASVADITNDVFKYLPLSSFKNVWGIVLLSAFS